MAAETFAFDEFWKLLDEHRDCIESIATETTVFYDLGERVAGFHWHPAIEREDEERLYVIEVHAAHDLLGAAYIRPQEAAGVRRSDEEAEENGENEEGVRYEVLSEDGSLLLAVTFAHDLAEEHEEATLQN
jgi:hypothetical protein